MNTWKDIDWAATWRAQQEPRRAPDDSAYWDSRAETFKQTAGKSEYAATFLEYADIHEGETVFDMGCGSGTLSVPLAQKGHYVCAVDFSHMMLHYLEEDAREKALDSIRTIQASWEDDWEAAGVDVCDVAIASRSIAVADLVTALKKLDAHARRRVCIAVAAGEPPRYDSVLWEALGRPLVPCDDFVYCINILFSWGIKPELRYINSWKCDDFVSKDDAIENIRRHLGTITPDEEPHLANYFDTHLVQRPAKDGHLAWMRDYALPTSWAFIAWNKSFDPQF